MEIENLLEVRVGDEIYGFDADKIDQILRVPEITPVPLSGEVMVGVCVLFGKIFNVVDLCALLNDNRVDRDKDSARLLTLSDEQVGLLVDEVLNMVTLDKNRYEEAGEGSEIVGFYKEEDSVVQILEASKIVSDISMDSFVPKEINPLENSSEDENSIDSGETKRFLFFKVKDESYAIDIEILRELIFVPEEITPIAGSDALGMIKLREEIITLLDIDGLLGFDKKEIDGKSRVLILKYRDKNVGLLVDEVNEIRDISLSMVEVIPENFKNEQVGAVYKDKDSVTSIISNHFLQELIKRYSINNEDKEIDDEDKSKDEIMSEVAVFKIADEEYAFDINEVQEIIAYEETIPVPESPEFVEGIINLRGAIIPIVSLPKRLGFESEITPKTKIVVCLIGSEKIGFIVDDVNEILFLEDKYISSSKSKETIFDEVINLDDGKRVILKIKTDKLIDKDELEQIEVQ